MWVFYDSAKRRMALSLGTVGAQDGIYLLPTLNYIHTLPQARAEGQVFRGLALILFRWRIAIMFISEVGTK